MRTEYMKDMNGKLKTNTDDDWPAIVIKFSDRERVIHSVDGQSLILQIRHQNDRRDGWRKWQSIFKKRSAEDMRRAMETDHPFASDIEKLDAICFKTTDGDYVDHSQ
jgi:hypothetical protein